MNTINMFWIGGKNESVQACINSFFKLNYIIDLWMYDYVDYLNCNIKDANIILPKNNYPKWAVTLIDKSELFRLYLIYKLGGWYVDTDCYCIQKFHEYDNYNIVVWFNKDKEILNNCIFRFEKESPILKYCIDNFNFNTSLSGYRQFSNNILKFSNSIKILDSDILNHTFNNIILDKTKIIHLFNSENSIKNINIINNINELAKYKKYYI